MLQIAQSRHDFQTVGPTRGSRSLGPNSPKHALFIDFTAQRGCISHAQTLSPKLQVLNRPRGLQWTGAFQPPGGQHLRFLPYEAIFISRVNTPGPHGNCIPHPKPAGVVLWVNPKPETIKHKSRSLNPNPKTLNSKPTRKHKSYLWAIGI